MSMTMSAGARALALMLAVALGAAFQATAIAAESEGYWAFKMTEVDTPSKEDLGKYCSYKGDGNRSGLLGLAHFETKCYSLTWNTTTTYAGNMAWGYHTQFDRPEAEFNQGLDVLVPGKLIGFALTATSTSQANGASAWVSMGTTHPNSGIVSVGATPSAPSGGKAVGKGYAKVIGKPVPLPNGKLPQLLLEFVISGGNSQRDIKVRYLYDWFEGGPGTLERPPEARHAANYLGCYKDAWDRDLAGYTFSEPGMNTQKCIAACGQRGFIYAATQYASHCFCANNYGKHGKATNCDMPCGGNKAEICGGNFANSVYEISGKGSKPPQPLPPPTHGPSTDASAIDWGTQPNNLGLTPGMSKLVTCPADGRISSRLWGTDIYTDDSSICTAAVHAGLIRVDNGGTVLVEGMAGQPAYRGSERNGVGSKDYGGWTGSFTVKARERVPSTPPRRANKSLTGAWVHSADGATITPDSKVIVLHEGNQVTLVGTYKMEVNRNQWQTYRCDGQLKGNKLPVLCRWVEGGNPMAYGHADWTMTFQVTPDRDHLNYRHTKTGPGQDSYYSRVP